MGETLKKIRDLIIIIGIYLYFIAWIYVHFYYRQFGISTESVAIDYSTYLMYSYNVLSSAKFLYWVAVMLVLLLAGMLCKGIITALAPKKAFFQKLHTFLLNNVFIRYIQKLNRQYSMLLLIVLLVIIFPLLFTVARQVAIDNYRQDRLHTGNLKTVQFIFRKDAEMMSPTVILDSALSRRNLLYTDISIIRDDPQQLLKLLGESDKYYIVLHQLPFNAAVGGLPSGYVYFINKQDILLSKIILRSF